MSCVRFYVDCGLSRISSQIHQMSVRLSVPSDGGCVCISGMQTAGCMILLKFLRGPGVGKVTSWNKAGFKEFAENCNISIQLTEIEHLCWLSRCLLWAPLLPFGQCYSSRLPAREAPDLRFAKFRFGSRPPKVTAESRHFHKRCGPLLSPITRHSRSLLGDCCYCNDSMLNTVAPGRARIALAGWPVYSGGLPIFYIVLRTHSTNVNGYQIRTQITNRYRIRIVAHNGNM